MKKFLFSILFLTLSCFVFQGVAQGLKSSGSNAADIVPNEWTSIFQTGDMNGDDIADLALIATPTNKDNMKVRDDGYVYNFNQPVLAIYWGKKNGGYSLFKQYDNVIPARPDEFLNITPSIDISSKGVLNITLELFASAGSWEQPTTTHRFRYQNGNFFLIGKDETVTARNTGKITTTSENYLTHKRIVTTQNFESNKKNTRRTTLPKTALMPLGFPLYE